MQQTVTPVAGRTLAPSRARTVLTAAAAFAALSLLPKVLVVAKDVAVAYYFGTGHALDVYLMAFVFIGVPVSTIVVALQTTLIPALVGGSGEAAAPLLGGAMKLTLSALLLVLPLWLWALPVVLNSLYPAATESTRANLLQACYWLIPHYFLGGINLLMYGALIAKRTFWVNAVLPGVFPVAIIAALGFAEKADIRALLIGTVMGSLIECIVLYAMTTRNKVIQWRNTAGSGLRPVLITALPLMIGSIASSFAPMVEQMIAFKLGPGAVSLLSYGNKVPNAINGLLVTAIGIVMLPHFADLVAARQWRESRALHWRLSGILIAIGLVVAALGIVFAEKVVRLLFQRGAFTAADSQTTAAVMRVYLLQLPVVLAAMVSVRVLAAMGQTYTLTAIAILQLALVSSLAYLFSQQFGIIGVPFGTVTAAFVGMCLMAYAVRRGFVRQCEVQNT